MAKAWRIVGWIVLILLVAGIVLGGAGWLTGASLPRMIELVFGGTDGAKAAVEGLFSRTTSALEQLSSTF